jgi:peptidyl-prolyl cis-trans isomerase SurA
MIKKVQIIFLFALLIIASTLTQDVYGQSADSVASEDSVASVVGKDTIFQSDVDAQYNYLLLLGNAESDDLKCSVLEGLIIDGIFLTKAHEKIKIKDRLVDAELERRIDSYILQYGSKEVLEKSLEQPLAEIRSSFRVQMKNQLQVAKLKRKILKAVTVTPEEVKEYFEAIPKDSLPLIPAEVELSQIVIKPSFSDEAKAEAENKLMEIYNLVIGGTREFNDLAREFSMDPGTKNGGFLGAFKRGQMVPEFDKVTFRLKEGEISPPFESPFGFHIVQLHSRDGDRVTASHILIIPKQDHKDDDIAIAELSRIKDSIITGSISFEKAAVKWSEDDSSKDCGGCILDPANGELLIPVDMLDPDLFFKVDQMEVGEISEPVKYAPRHTSLRYFHILYLKKRTEAHIANLKDDCKKLYDAALMNKQNSVIEQWLEKEKENVSVEIKGDNCKALRDKWSAKN